MDKIDYLETCKFYVTFFIFNLVLNFGDRKRKCKKHVKLKSASQSWYKWVVDFYISAKEFKTKSEISKK